MNEQVLEWVGYIASLIVLVSLLMSSVKKLRLINLVGASLFGAYGFLIGSLPTGFMNLGIVMIDIFFLSRMYMSKDFFRVIQIENDTDYLHHFLDFYKEDIERYQDVSRIDFEKAAVKLYLLRNMNPAGIFVCHEFDKKTLEITLDYVIPMFRDLKNGQFIFEGQKLYFLGKGYNRFVVFSEKAKHIKYLKKMGFTETKLKTKIGYVKSIY